MEPLLLEDYSGLYCDSSYFSRNWLGSKC